MLNSNRGSQGVAIVLSQEGVIAWKVACSELHNDSGARIIAIRLLLKDIHNKDVSVFLVFAYAPAGNAPDDVWNEYRTASIERKRKSDILIIGILILVWGLLLHTVVVP